MREQVGRLGHHGAQLALRATQPVRALPWREVSDALRGESLLTGVEVLPEQGPAIIAAHQRTLADARALVSALPRRASVVGIGALESAVAARRAQETNRDALSRAVATLADGGVVVVFPERGPSPDGMAHRGRAALGWLILAAQRIGAVPVIPAVVDVAQARVLLGTPLDFSRHADVVADRTIARGVTDEVMDAVVSTGGLGYRDSYVTTARAQRRSAAGRLRDRTRSDLFVRRREQQLAHEQQRREHDEERRFIDELLQQAHQPGHDEPDRG